MLSDLVKGLRWSSALGIKFLRVVPYSTLAIVLLTLVSQIAMLLASFLPLKVIIMLGSEDTPRYFPDFLAVLERDVLIAVLSAGTIGFFLVHLIAEKMIERATEAATRRLLAKSQKMVLFENQEGVAASSYQRYSRTLAGAAFITLALFGLGWFYPKMSLIMFGYFLFILFFLWQAAHYSARMRERLEAKLAPLMKVLGTVGFFVAFGFLVADFVFFTPPGVIVALVSFLLVRQAMQRAAGGITDLRSLYQQKPKLNALFFHGQVFQPLLGTKKTVWPLLIPEVRQNWVAEVLNTLVEVTQGELDCHWLQLGIRNVVGLRVTRGEQQFLFKIYETNRSSLALHEADLMIEAPEGLPSARWLGTVPVEKFHCLVYQLEPGRQPKGYQVKEYEQRLQAALLAVPPRPAVTGRYIRSKAMLWQRITPRLLERLRVATSTSDEKHALAVLLARLPSLQQLLAALPVTIFSPELTQDAIWISDGENGQGGDVVLLNWGRWALEPVGAGWPVVEKQLKFLAEALEAGAAKRAEFADVKIEQVELAALAFALERECTRQRYNHALKLVPRILERLAILENTDSSRTMNAG